MSAARTLAIEALQRIAAFDEHEHAGPAKFDALATIAAIAALEAETGEPVAETDKHEGGERGFTIRSEAWYGKAVAACESNTIDEIMVGMYHPEGGTTGEFGVRWTMLGDKPTPRLEVFNDAWHALQRFGDLLAWMASVDNQHVSPQVFAAALRSMGVKDLTKRTNPYTSPAEREYASWQYAAPGAPA